LIVSAPTGYGKTISAPLIASELIRRGFSYSFIHSLPLRAIVRDVYLCLLLNSLVNRSELRERCRKSEEVLSLVRRALEEVGVDVTNVAYQMGEHLSDGELEGYQRKEPLFDARYVVTTLDSLALNVFRIPVVELYSYRRHYTIPWSRVYVSALLLDEAHAIVEDYNESSRRRTFTVFKVMLEAAASARIPVVVSSATLPRSLVETVLESVGGGTVVELGRSAEEGKYRVVVKDTDFENSVLSVRWRTGTVTSSEIMGKVVEEVESGRRVFVACDSIGRAVELYRELSSQLGREEVALLHSMLKMGDREERLKRLSEPGRVKVLVATSVVEAGVDLSFDSLITDGGNPFSVIQRAGRVCRDLRCGEAEIHVVRDFSDPGLIEFVEKCRDRVLWRLPYDLDGMCGYGRLLESVTLEEDPKIRSLLETLLHPLLIPQGDIELILRRLGGSLLRELLVTVLVGEDGELGGLSYREVLRSAVVTDLEHVKRLTSRGCITGLYALLASSDDPTRVEEVRRVDLEMGIELGRVFGNTSVGRVVSTYFESLRRIYREHRGRVLSAVFLASKRCYGDEGLWHV
jgi:CRISPR-associated endonuclease/helicase Cas3